MANVDDESDDLDELERGLAAAHHAMDAWRSDLAVAIKIADADKQADATVNIIAAAIDCAIMKQAIQMMEGFTARDKRH